jgi:hypothetical protein
MKSRTWGGKADGDVIRPVGTYHGTPAANRLSLVMLTTERTHHYEINRNECGMILPVPFDGIYTFTKSGDQRFIRLKDVDGNLLARYEYKLSDDTLKLRADSGTTWETLKHVADAEAYCGSADDCSIQQLAQPRCPGQWTCEANACVYDCRMPCDLAGGSCVALYPGACADGVVGDANDYSCGGGLGVMCCLPKPAENACVAAGGSCVGLAPGNCADGVVGDANDYSCGGGLGVMCCLPKPAGSAEGEMCGGFAGIRCADGLYCKYAEGMCGMGDTSGTCQPAAEICYQIVKPVCGCNNETYSNDCYAARAKVSVKAQGPCAN